MMNSEINKYIEDEMTVLERSPFENLAEEKRLNAFKHYGFWQPIDTIREKEQLENVLKEKNEMPWIWNEDELCCMKISIFTSMTNPEERNDPWEEALNCYKDFAYF